MAKNGIILNENCQHFALHLQEKCADVLIMMRAFSSATSKASSEEFWLSRWVVSSRVNCMYFAFSLVVKV